MIGTQAVIFKYIISSILFIYFFIVVNITKIPDDAYLGRLDKTAHNNELSPQSTLTNYITGWKWTSVTFVTTNGTRRWLISTDFYDMLSTVNKDRTTIPTEDTKRTFDNTTENITDDNGKLHDKYVDDGYSSGNIEYMDRILIAFCLQMELELLIAVCD